MAAPPSPTPPPEATVSHSLRLGLVCPPADPRLSADSAQVKVKVKVMLRPTVSRPVCLGPKTRFLLLSDSCAFLDVESPPWREGVSVDYNCCWSSPAQSLSSLSPAELMTIFYCLRFKIPPTRRATYPYIHLPEIVWPCYTLLRVAKLQ
jgi:hypothetical protein